MARQFNRRTLPERPIAFAAAIAVLLFAVWTWREARAAGPDEVVKVAEPRHVLLAVISSFVLAEPATRQCSPLSRWPAITTGRGSGSIRATTGMVLADGVAIAVGACCTSGSTAGLVAVGVTAAVAVATAVAAASGFVPNRREHQVLPPLESSPDPGGPPAGYCPSND